MENNTTIPSNILSEIHDATTIEMLCSLFNQSYSANPHVAQSLHQFITQAKENNSTKSLSTSMNNNESCESKNKSPILLSDKNIRGIAYMEHNKDDFFSVAKSSVKRLIIEKVSILIDEWVKETHGDTFIARVEPFGSFIMDGGFDESDLNLLVILPSALNFWESDENRSFERFVAVHNENDIIQHFRVLDNAFMPAIKFVMMDIEVDMIACSLSNCYITNAREVDLFDAEIIRRMDSKDLRALNGYRNCKMILDNVGNQYLYCCVLRFIKAWAARKGIYSSTLGYLGGISWSILVAKVFTEFPPSPFPGFLFTFFNAFSTWNWNKPVILKFGGKPPINLFKRESMKIVSPVEPVQITSFNTTHSAKKIISMKFKEAMTQLYLIGTKSQSWLTLLTPDVFCKYYYFLQICFYYDKFTTKVHEFRALVEARLRFLVYYLEDLKLHKVHLCSQRYDMDHGCYWLIGLQLPKNNHLLHMKDLRLVFFRHISEKCKEDCLTLMDNLKICFVRDKDLSNYQPKPILFDSAAAILNNQICGREADGSADELSEIDFSSMVSGKRNLLNEVSI